MAMLMRLINKCEIEFGDEKPNKHIDVVRPIGGGWAVFEEQLFYCPNCIHRKSDDRFGRKIYEKYFEL